MDRRAVLEGFVSHFSSVKEVLNLDTGNVTQYNVPDNNYMLLNSLANQPVLANLGDPALKFNALGGVAGSGSHDSGRLQNTMVKTKGATPNAYASNVNNINKMVNVDVNNEKANVGVTNQETRVDDNAYHDRHFGYEGLSPEFRNFPTPGFSNFYASVLGSDDTTTTTTSHHQPNSTHKMEASGVRQAVVNAEVKQTVENTAVKQAVVNTEPGIHKQAVVNTEVKQAVANHEVKQPVANTQVKQAVANTAVKHPVANTAVKQPVNTSDGVKQSLDSKTFEYNNFVGSNVSPSPSHQNKSYQEDKVRQNVSNSADEVKQAQYSKPFEYGWRRELVYRASFNAASLGGKLRQGDVYYYTPTGKRLRSLVEISKIPLEPGLTLENFTFSPFPTGVNDMWKETVRAAYTRLYPTSKKKQGDDFYESDLGGFESSKKRRISCNGQDSEFCLTPVRKKRGRKKKSEIDAALGVMNYPKLNYNDSIIIENDAINNSMNNTVANCTSPVYKPVERCKDCIKLRKLLKQKSKGPTVEVAVQTFGEATLTERLQMELLFMKEQLASSERARNKLEEKVKELKKLKDCTQDGCFTSERIEKKRVSIQEPDSVESTTLVIDESYEKADSSSTPPVTIKTEVLDSPERASSPERVDSPEKTNSSERMDSTKKRLATVGTACSPQRVDSTERADSPDSIECLEEIYFTQEID